MPPRDGDKVQARQRINVEVRTGHRPHPNSLPCADCSHVWAPGQRRHEYDHHLGYAAEHHYDVEPVCTKCHRRRVTERGELQQRRGPEGRYISKEANSGREHAYIVGGSHDESMDRLHEGKSCL